MKTVLIANKEKIIFSSLVAIAASLLLKDVLGGVPLGFIIGTFTLLVYDSFESAFSKDFLMELGTKTGFITFGFVGLVIISLLVFLS